MRLTASLLLFLMLVAPLPLLAAEPDLESPHWSVEIKGGLFHPDLPDWSRYYDSRWMPGYGFAAAYKIIPQIDIGGSAGSYSKKGHRLNFYHGTPADSQTYELNPLELFIILRGQFVQDQWVIPYFGGGWTTLYYRQKLPEGTVRGSAGGYHLRGGIQLSLDNLDVGASQKMYSDYHILHTYFILEAER
ncbi:MAG: hypothetical protein M0042_05030, partial [Nitrospiraceae bacterium]|nr:hypothetical protein [Nitrospiraceae bacterium]